MFGGFGFFDHIQGDMLHCVRFEWGENEGERQVKCVAVTGAGTRVDNGCIHQGGK